MATYSAVHADDIFGMRISEMENKAVAAGVATGKQGGGVAVKGGGKGPRRVLGACSVLTL